MVTIEVKDMSTTNKGSIDRSVAGNSPSMSFVAGSGGVIVSQPVKFDGITSMTVIKCDASDDKVIGIAGSTESEGSAVKVYVNGATVETDQTLTEGGLVGVDATGVVEDYSTGTYIGSVVKSATGASQVYINIQY